MQLGDEDGRKFLHLWQAVDFENMTPDIPMVPQKTLGQADLAGGDLILCYAAITRGQYREDDNGYSHAAIYLGDSHALESVGGGVRTCSIGQLTNDYDHLAILRNSELWNGERLTALKQFAETITGRQFNLAGLKNYDASRSAALDSAMERIKRYFEGQELPPSPLRDSYFCSELVVAAFIYVGIIRPSAAIVFVPEILLPEDLAKDKLFGFYQGHMVPYPGYKIPEDDMFRFSY